MVSRVPGGSWNMSPIYFHLAATSIAADRMPCESCSPVEIWQQGTKFTSS